MSASKSIKLNWDVGTGYDFFASLILLYNPDTYGLRSSWASGMRQRLPEKERKKLAEFTATLGQAPPLYWLNGFAGQKNSKAVLGAFTALEPLERVYWFSGFPHDEEEGCREIIEDVAKQGKWNDSHVNGLMAYHQKSLGKSYPQKQYKSFMDDWAKGLEVMSGIEQAFQVYYEMFFEEEERRILTFLERGLAKSKKLAEKLAVRELVVELSQGIEVRDSAFEIMEQLTLIPSFWMSPYIFSHFTKNSMIMYGVRPENVSLIPGEVVPDGLLTLLECLANPTRLQILRYLDLEELTATQIAAKLRLRTPTVAHHLKSLRRAGLVLVRSKENQKEVYYQARLDRVTTLSKSLGKFIIDS